MDSKQDNNLENLAPRSYPQYKRCGNCGKNKSADDFSKDKKNKKHGLQSICKVCARERAKAWREANPERQHGLSKAWREANPERERERAKAWREANHERQLNLVKVWREANAERVREINRECSKAWYQSNRERACERAKAWREANPERERERAKAWREANHELIKARSHRRRACKKNAEGTHTSEDVRLQYNSQKGKCWHCGVELNGVYHVDHLIPLAKGGTNAANNIVCACAKCNLSKGAKTTQEWNGRLF